MSTLFSVIEELCHRDNITITEMCRQCGASRASLTDLKMGRKQGLSADTLSKIATYFNVSIDFLLGKQNASQMGQTIPMDSFTYAMHNASKDLSDKDKEILLSMAQQLQKANTKDTKE